MSYKLERKRMQRRPTGGRNRTLGCLVGAIWIVLLGAIAYQYLLKPQLSAYLGQQVAGIGAPTNQIQSGAAQLLPTAVALLPSGEVRVDEAAANAYLQQNAASLGPIESAQVRFVPGEVQIAVRALGSESVARSGLAVQDGRLVTVSPSISGPLGSLIAPDALLAPIQRQLGDELARQGRRITAVRIEQGAVILVVEG